MIRHNPLLRRAFETVGRPALDWVRRDTMALVHYGRGHGYQFEAAEVMRCLPGRAVRESAYASRRNPGRPGDDR